MSKFSVGAAFTRLNIKQIMLIGIVVRLAAAIFSKGFAYQDDHFGVVELAWQWKDGIPFNWTGGTVYIFSLVYAGIHYVFLYTCDELGIRDPQHVMLIIRLFHAVVSTLTIYYSYKLSQRLTADEETSRFVALVMAVFWIFPFMSVRNLQEFFCVPFLIVAGYHIADTRLTNRSALFAGFFFAIAFSIRMQTAFIPLGIGLCLVFKRNCFWKAVFFGVSFIISILLTQGLLDFALYGNPAASIVEYFRYNANPANIKGYPQGPWYQYIGTVAGAVWVLPFFILAWGYIGSARLSFQARMLFVGSLLFFAFHSYYSNKQERFILPFIPFFLLLGIAGFRSYLHQDRRGWLKKLARFSVAWFLILNTPALLVLTFSYSKRARVESMSFLRRKGDVRNIVIEAAGSPPQLPLFYLGQHLTPFRLPSTKTMEQLHDEIDTSSHPSPNYLIMSGSENLTARLQRLKTLYPRLLVDTIVHPGFVDNLAYKLNPRFNENESWYIFRIQPDSAQTKP